jgi:hypothetical protein
MVLVWLFFNLGLWLVKFKERGEGLQVEVGLMYRVNMKKIQKQWSC